MNDKEDIVNLTAGQLRVRRWAGGAFGMIVGYCTLHVLVFYFVGDILMGSFGKDVLGHLSSPLEAPQVLNCLMLAGVLLWAFRPPSLNGSVLRYAVLGGCLFVAAVSTRAVRSSATKEPRPSQNEAEEKPDDVLKQLELVQYKTGFIRHIDLNSQQVLWQPIVLLKFKNVSGKEIRDSVSIRAVFARNGEEWGDATAYFQRGSDSPLQSGYARQVSLQSSVGFKSEYGVFQNKSPLACQIFIGNRLLKTVKIDNGLLDSNRL